MDSVPTTSPAISAERLWRSLMETAQFGANENCSEGVGRAETEPVTLQVLPIRTDAGDEASKASGGGGGGDFIYEPTREALLERLLPMYVEVMVFRAMLESQASEHGARMTAMDNATRNAGDLIKSLTIQMNRTRQAQITKELIEIISGAEAL